MLPVHKDGIPERGTRPLPFGDVEGGGNRTTRDPLSLVLLLVEAILF
jgi:hypothetical protein